MKLKRYLEAAQRSVQRHGGGAAGLWSVLRRVAKVVRAMGVRGLLARLRSASTPHQQVSEPMDAPVLPEPVALEHLTLKVGVMAHVFYPDLIEEFAQTLAVMPVPYVLLVSVMDPAAEQQARERLTGLPNVARLVVKRVQNRGRDIAPMLVSFHDDIVGLDIIGHIHTKKSLYTGSEQQSWRRYLIDSLFGSSDRVAWLLGMFQAKPGLGLVYPESYPGVPLWAHTWLSNAEVCDALAQRLGIAIDRTRYIDFPAGSMFWARVQALRPLFDLKLRLDDFPVESGQIDGTLQHAVERMLAVVARQQGYRLGILPPDGSLSLAAEGERNVHTALESPLRDRLQFAALDAKLITVDVFDTLVTRAFLTPAAAREHLAWRMQRRLGISAFRHQREEAELAERARLGRDPTLGEIYEVLAVRAGHSHEHALELAEAERAHERELLRARAGVLDALEHVGAVPFAAFSDMYLTQADMRAVLPDVVTRSIQRWWISCETGQRKDQLTTWTRTAINEGRTDGRWLHVGDNEHADIQMPQLAKLLTPVHVLRPAALLDVVPALRPLRSLEGASAPWPELLWRGLLANRFATIADNSPQDLLGHVRLDAESLGYVVLGPLLLDFLLHTVETARRRNVDTLLFLSREGHLLDRAFSVLKKSHTGAAMLKGTYFLASRRATLLPSLRLAEDVARVTQGTYNGNLRALLHARLGEDAASIVAASTPYAMERDVFLPEMADEVMDWLRPAIPPLLALAEQQREAYAAYWKTEVGDASAMVVDIGYAGSIQRQLSLLLDRPMGGTYLALRSGAAALADTGCWAEARYVDERKGGDHAGSVILQNDLLLESLLAAPQGQFNGFSFGSSAPPVPTFGPMELSRPGVEVLERVHQGALSFIQDVCEAIGEDVSDMSLDPDGVQIPLQCLATGRWRADEALSLLATDDAFTGRGQVQAGRS